MLNNNDILFMETNVRDIINMWNTTIDIHIPLPVNEQPNWNPVLCEYNGEVKYDILYDVHAERKDMQNMMIGTVDTTNAGDYVRGRLVFAISDEIQINTDCIIEYLGDNWRIETIRNRIGENIIVIDRNVGDADV